MTSKLSLLGPKEIQFRDESHLESDFSRVFKSLNRRGYCIVHPWDTSEASLTQIRQKFGFAQQHVRANDIGTVAVCSQASPWKQQIDTSQYLGLQTSEHFPHTDGAYLNGFIQTTNKIECINPPAYVLLQCVKSSSVGGASIVIDGQAILEDLLRKTPSIARALYEQGCVSFCRDNQSAFWVAIYEKLSVGRYRLRFRYDKTVYPSSKHVCEALRYLYDHYLTNARYRTTFRLEPGQVLIVDNLRMLHGRTSFKSNNEHERFLRRTWVVDDTSPEAPTSLLGDVGSSCRVFERLKNYARMEQAGIGPTPPINPGIYLPGNLEAVLHRQDSDEFPAAC